MKTLRVIVYPVGGAVAGMIFAALAGMALFGIGEWQLWQNQVTTALADISALIGAVAGVYLAHRTGRHRWCD